MRIGDHTIGNMGGSRWAILLIAAPDQLLLVSGNGDVIAPDDGVLYAGSGGAVAGAAARALVRHADLGLAETCRAALGIAAEIDLYTNDRITLLETPAPKGA